MRRPNVLRPIRLTTTFPEDIRVRLDLFLWSDVEGRVPKGAYQQFLVERIQDFFQSESLDLSKVINVPNGNPVIRGSADAIRILSHLLGVAPK